MSRNPIARVVRQMPLRVIPDKRYDAQITEAKRELGTYYLTPNQYDYFESIGKLPERAVRMEKLL